MVDEKTYAGYWEPRDLWIVYEGELLPVPEVLKRIDEEEEE